MTAPTNAFDWIGFACGIWVAVLVNLLICCLISKGKR